LSSNAHAGDADAVAWITEALRGERSGGEGGTGKEISSVHRISPAIFMLALTGSEYYIESV
jgi:hypothetical protein